MSDKPVIKPTVHPIVASLPPHLKDPANYEKIQRLLIESLAGKCSHGEISEWAVCVDCQRRFAARSGVLKRLGFRNAKQYMAWKKIHETIKARVPFPKYNSPI